MTKQHRRILFGIAIAYFLLAVLAYYRSYQKARATGALYVVPDIQTTLLKTSAIWPYYLLKGQF